MDYFFIYEERRVELVIFLRYSPITSKNRTQDDIFLENSGSKNNAYPIIENNFYKIV